jgi:ParB-like nuclease family protein
VSDLEPSATDPSHDVDRRSHPEDVAGLLAERTEREGLPRSYRMRADAHYVDQLDNGHGGPVIRVIPTRQIEALNLATASTPGSLPGSAGSTTLAQSVAAHGILQPLLVRRRGGRYQLIAGRKRLAVALAAGLPGVPCVIHEADDVKAAALTEADNVREASGAPGQRAEDVDCIQEVLQALSSDLAGMNALITFLGPLGGQSRGTLHQATADLLQAQAWRAAWLAGAAAIVMSPYRPGRAKPVASTLDRLRSGFEAETRLSRVQLEFAVAPEAGRMTFDENLGHAIAGMIFSTLTWLQGVDDARLEIRADAPTHCTLKCQIVQRCAAPPQTAFEYVQGREAYRAGDAMATIGILAAKTFAAQSGDTIELAPVGRRGSVLQGSFGRSLHD